MHEVEHELHQHARALRSLARRLVGEHAADDLVQDVAMHALRRPPARGGPLLAWLRGVARHLANRYRRAARRRRAHEDAAAHRTRVGAEPAQRTVEDREVLRLLTTALLELPEPYQGTLLQRFLRDRTPTEIADAAGVPLATVKSRLQRGLALLRERLNSGQQGWHAAFAATFGFERAAEVAAAGSAAAGTTVLTGIAIMATGTKMAVAAGAVVALATALWLLGSDGFELAPSPTLASPSSTGREATDRGLAFDAVAASPGADVSERMDAVRAQATTEASVVIRGRCVDEHGLPLDGVQVSLHGTPHREGLGKDFMREYGDWLLRHGGRSPWRDRAVASGADGRFAFDVPPSPLGLALWIRRSGLDHTLGIDQQLVPAIVDLGDLRVPETCTLQCRVVDTAGRAIPSPMVQVQREEAQPEARGTLRTRIGEFTADADGLFSVLVVAGAVTFAIQSREVVRGATLTVPPLLPRLVHEIVAREFADEQQIAGTVAEESGRLLAGVEVRAWGEGDHAAARTDAFGRFVLSRSRLPDEGGVSVSFDIAGFESATRPSHWGEREVRVVLRECAGFEVLAVRNADGTPLTTFGVRVWRDPTDTPNARDNGGVEIASGDHPNGIARVVGLARGRYFALVDPHTPDLWPSDLFAVEVAVPAAARAVVRLVDVAERELRVERSDGSGVARAEVEVVDRIAEPLGPDTGVAALGDWRNLRTDGTLAPVLAQRTWTSADGTARIRGPADRPVHLRITHAHRPFVVHDVRAAVAEPLVVRLPAGGRLVATISPPELIRILREGANLPAEGPAADAPRGTQGFRVRRGSGSAVEHVPPIACPAVLCDGAGVLAIEDLPAGDWNLCLAPLDCSAGHRHVWPPVPVASATVREGQTTEITVDLAHWLPAELRGTVTCGGRPFASERLYVDVLREVHGQARPVHTAGSVMTDEHGRFDYRCRGGIASVVTIRRRPGGGTGPGFRSLTPVELRPGGTVEHVFALEPCRLRLRLLRGNGHPAVGASVVLTQPGEPWQRQYGPADERGEIAAEIEAGAFTVELLPDRRTIGIVTASGASADAELRVPH